MKLTTLSALLLVSATLLTSQVFASPIVGQGDPTDVITGGTTVDFESFALGNYTSLSQSGFTLSGTNNLGSGPLRISNSYAGSYNGRGTQYVDNGAGNGYQSLTFTFNQPVDSFAFLFGASDDVWNLTAYDATNTAIESFDLTATHSSNAGDYFGVQAAGIASATLTDTSSSGDWVFVDNVTFHTNAVSAVPEANTSALLSLALPLVGAVAVARRRKK